MGSQMAACDPERYLGGDTSKLIDPCGLVAWSNFNDTFQVQAAPQSPSLVRATLEGASGGDPAWRALGAGQGGRERGVQHAGWPLCR